MQDLSECDVFRSADEFEFADYGIVFGCDFLSEMEFRIQGAIELFRRNQLGTLILTGGATGKSEQSEAEWMKQAALDAAIPLDRLLLETDSQTTQQNMLNCGKLIQARRDRERQPETMRDPPLDDANADGRPITVALITSDWHMARAWMMAKKHLPESLELYCAPQQTTCNAAVWPETIQCACLVRSELQRVKHAMSRGYKDPRTS